MAHSFPNKISKIQGNALESYFHLMQRSYFSEVARNQMFYRLQYATTSLQSMSSSDQGYILQ